eukprot:TRINITY_DN3593_c0_g1_i1.p1 TRINITY_DN3593_c0_g1~~TRINITY_DN3593_c0_g1_i1.p1  ORF type:complete len:494 (+),score=142.70 TRINITY_DN3593_c0_g1_i1:174-1655(+)
MEEKTDHTEQTKEVFENPSVGEKRERGEEAPHEEDGEKGVEKDAEDDRDHRDLKRRHRSPNEEHSRSRRSSSRTKRRSRTRSPSRHGHRHSSRHRSHRHSSRSHRHDHHRSRDRHRSHRSRTPEPSRSHDRKRSSSAERRRRERHRETTPPNATPETEELRLERAQRTVFVQQVSKRATEDEIKEFFEERGIGPVKSVVLMWDKHSRRSRGMGFVEFETTQAVPFAIQCTGFVFKGVPIMCRPSEAEKNVQPSTTVVTNASAGSMHPPSGFSPMPAPIPAVPTASPVAASHEQSSRPTIVLLTNLPIGVSEDSVKSLIAGGVPIDRMELVDDKAYIDVGDTYTAERVARTTRGMTFQSRPLQVSVVSSFPPRTTPEFSQSVRMGFHTGPRFPPVAPPLVSRVLFLENMFAEGDDDDDLVNEVVELSRDVLQSYGDIRKMLVEKGTNGRVHVVYEHALSARNAASELNGRTFDERIVRASVEDEAVFVQNHGPI